MDELPNKDCLLDHVAIAVEDIAEARKFYETLGLSFEDRTEIVASEGVVSAFAPVDANCRLELLAPHGEGAIAKFLRTKGPGLHHICLRVADVRQKCHELRAEGFRLVYDEPRTGAGGSLINFIHPKSADGVLIELSQRPVEQEE